MSTSTPLHQMSVWDRGKELIKRIDALYDAVNNLKIFKDCANMNELVSPMMKDKFIGLIYPEIFKVLKVRHYLFEDPVFGSIWEDIYAESHPNLLEGQTTPTAAAMTAELDTFDKVAAEQTDCPLWAKELIERMEALDKRLDKLERSSSQPPAHLRGGEV